MTRRKGELCGLWKYKRCFVVYGNIKDVSWFMEI
jgi:hypothetical protein